MKFSEQMLKGFVKVDGRQCKGNYSTHDLSTKTTSYCVLGAAIEGGYRGGGAVMRFRNEWGVDLIQLNDQGMPWEHLYGMARAAGI